MGRGGHLMLRGTAFLRGAHPILVAAGCGA